jgi:imidazoleglycerol-phosphate dehydratase
MKMTVPSPGVRFAEIIRETNETQIRTAIDLDGTGHAQVETSIGFLDHMLCQVARHGLLDLVIVAHGDLYVDEHHIVEDTGLCLGKVCSQALGDRRSINRYGWAMVPMDEALALVALDFSGRPHLEFDAQFKRETVGMMPVESVKEFFRAFVSHAMATLHIRLLSGENDHHCIEAIFKAFAKSLELATRINPRQPGVPSTKGHLEGAISPKDSEMDL